MIPLVESFLSIQGEGVNVGRLAYFVRFAGCNLDCSFGPGSVCDTPWRQARAMVPLGWLVEDACAQTMWKGGRRSGAQKDRPMIVITGGEPVVSPHFTDVVSAFRDEGFYIALETNGTKWVDGVELCDHVTVSPKAHVDQLRTVQSAESDPAMAETADEVRYLITGHGRAWAPPYLNPRAQHYVSPAFYSDGSGERKARVVPEAMAQCQKIIHAHPRFRLSIQLHKLIGVR